MTSAVAETVGQYGGQIAGGALGGVIGGFLGGPVGAWIGRAVGSRVGGMAGRAAAGAIASYMEGANEAAETETKEQEAAKPCVDCGEIDCFNPPEGSTPDEIKEFKRQLDEQQKAINEIPPDTLLKNMDNYEKIGRGAKDAVDRANAREAWIKNRAAEILKQDPSTTAKAARDAAAKDIKTMDVIHTPDLSPGGTGQLSTENGGMGPRSTNRSIGSQWSKAGPTSDKTRLQQLNDHAQKARDKGEATNVDLKICEDGKSSKSGKSGSKGSGGSGKGQGGGPGNIPMS
ncbi:polymorphic toxin type 15 domain-containing protein [Rhizobium hidalgonense]|uniref:polymorphic toxin type 15 domain-containing protein n=1 Tax=Rhizobium hidalgonense TaxID=1538159 RepID=UPI00287243DA|nr:polymorphic toxin type 15 domain-containing protein [Rhizobium hidalgonense]MDR9810540.1 polymorphic toxin type 15 domain-containing protein [Rhizobium hidalgonense]